MSITEIPNLPTEKLIEIAEAYEAAVKLYHTRHMKQSCRDIAAIVRAEIAKR